MLKLLTLLFLTTTQSLAVETFTIVHNEKFGGFSGLFFHQNKLYTLTDRGPNHEAVDLDGNGTKDRIFPNPDYSPTILEINLEKSENKTLTISRAINLKRKNKSLTGLPNLLKSQSPKIFDEDAFSPKGKKPLPPDPIGIDPEGIAVSDNGHFWICEEYGPSLLEFDQDGQMLRRIVPQGSVRQGLALLPKILNQRKLNRGFEGLTSFEGKLYFTLQSPIPNKKAKKITPLFSMDIKTLELKHFLYKQEKKKNKIGALTHLKGDEFLILEQNPKKKFQVIYKIKLDKPVELTEKLLDSKSKSVTSVSKQEYLKLDLPQIEKVEGMELHQGHLYLIEDNDFGLRNKEKKGQSILAKIKAPST